MSADVVVPPPFTEPEAHQWLGRVVQDRDAYVARMIEGYHRRAWLGLGFGSWEDLCRAKSLPQLTRDERRAVVGEMREAGMSTRAIAEATGASQTTITRDIESGDPNGSPDPDTTTATESPFIAANYSGRCDLCAGAIEPGETIGATGHSWAHARCLR